MFFRSVEIHALTSCAAYIGVYSGYRKESDDRGFVLVWPQGTENADGGDEDRGGGSFNANGWCCGGALAANVDDIGFLEQVVIASVQNNNEYNIDPERVYMAGHSNGCAMAQRMGIAKPEWVAAIGCHSLYLTSDVTETLDPPVPMIEIHGSQDWIVPYDGWSVYGAIANLERWKYLNGCDDIRNTTEEMAYSTVTYESCNAGSKVSLITLEGVGHLPYKGSNTGVDTTAMALDFVMQFTKPGALSAYVMASPTDPSNDDEAITTNVTIDDAKSSSNGPIDDAKSTANDPINENTVASNGTIDDAISSANDPMNDSAANDAVTSCINLISAFTIVFSIFPLFI